MKYFIFTLLSITSLSLPSTLLAQYRWHVLLPDHVDPAHYRGIESISCSGENCLVTEQDWKPQSFDFTNLILTSHDGGLTWDTVAGNIPKWWFYPHGRTGLDFAASQQIDSLNAIVADFSVGELLITHDGWRTWRIDSSEKHGGIREIYFANAAEGIMQGAFGNYWSTTDSGNHWSMARFYYAGDFGINCQAYGHGLFRVFGTPNKIYTTHDNWQTWDTTTLQDTGPRDLGFHSTMFYFGGGDTIAAEGYRRNPIGQAGWSVGMALSTDLGVTWRELDVPRPNGIVYTTSEPLSLDWRHMVIAGQDTVGRIVQSFDGGAHWECDTVPLSNGKPYRIVKPFAVTGSGRLLAAVGDTAGSYLVYLERAPESVVAATRKPDAVPALYPDPASRLLNLPSEEPTIVSDALGRQYPCQQAGDRLDVSSLPSGVYYLVCGSYHSRFVKE